ncbi:putative spermidine/putrescine transport system substrate-binding protein [Sinosporangium album]|uniref:Putative spermidine/putrescine transport system substrate-binding protein n=1 Tax=Sinosporangium album TaxID=504805 RepID=A0A1G7RRW8_9ACTN|nr:extracellular solute-binding protein [Sinosporangium album]SDG13445.1 putative spermidine/putrescine transport system substrate-binding protein [Sinosporangium album]
MAGGRLRRTRMVAVVGAAGVLLAACGVEGEARNATSVRVTPKPGATPTPTPPSQGTLRILTFRSYAEWGGVDPRLNWVSAFERESGCRIAKLDSVQTAEEMAAYMRGGTYDVVSAPPEMTGSLVADGKVKELDTSQVKGYGELSKRLRKLKPLADGDKVFGVPFLWGTYEPVGTGGKPKSWGDLLLGDKVALRDTPLTIALAALALKDRLGIKDPFQLSERQLDRAVGLLKAGKARHVYWKDAVDAVEAFVPDGGRGAVTGQVLPHQRGVLGKAGTRLRVAGGLPTTGWVDSWMMSSQASSPTCVYRWISHMTSAEVQGRAAAWTGLAPANTRACEGEARRMCEIYPAGDERRLRDVYFAVPPAKECKAQDGTCTDFEEWSREWRDLVRPTAGS